MVTKNKHLSLVKISFLQALGLVAYCSLVGLVLAYGNQWFGKIPQYFAPLLSLLLFSTSALICALITLSYPIILFLKNKQPVKALKLIFYTVLWLVFFFSIIIAVNLPYLKK